LIVVSNTSPIINLAAVNQLNILHELYDRIIIPEAVFHEISVIGAGQPDSEEVKEFDWIITQKVSNQTLVKALRIELNRGEAEAIAHEKNRPIRL
jgi:predicted nucleic acid-binding protein